MVPVELKAMPRFEFNVRLAVVVRLPPPNVSCPAVALAGAAPRLLSALTLKVPALMVAVPPKVFAPESVSVPDPDLVSDPLLLMTPLMVVFPAPPNVIPKVPLSTLPLTVNVPLVEPIVEALARVIAPDQLFVPLTFSSAPAPLTPALFRVNGSAPTAMLPCNCNEALLSTVVPLP